MLQDKAPSRSINLGPLALMTGLARHCRGYCHAPPPSLRAVGGGGERDRTDDLLLAKQALSQLSYTPKLRAAAPPQAWGWRRQAYRRYAGSPSANEVSARRRQEYRRYADSRSAQDKAPIAAAPRSWPELYPAPSRSRYLLRKYLTRRPLLLRKSGGPGRI